MQILIHNFFAFGILFKLHAKEILYFFPKSGDSVWGFSSLEVCISIPFHRMSRENEATFSLLIY